MVELDGYQIKDKIYESESSLIIRAMRKSDETPVVLKILNLDSPLFEQTAAFKHEYQVMEDLQGIESVPKAYELRKYKDAWVIILEDIQANSLKQLLDKKPISLKLFFPIAIQMVTALENIHKQGIFHKDINPSNIIYNVTTKKLQIIDFGLASKITHQCLISSNQKLLQGTLAYISPEQTQRMNRIIDNRSDLYSLGVTFYEMLTGQTPFQSQDPLEMIHQHIVKAPKPPHEMDNTIPEIVSLIIMKLISKKAEDRYQTASGLKLDLKKCWSEYGTSGAIHIFTLGEKDLVDRLEIPQKLYGRENEINLLIHAFDNVCLGSQEVALVYGSAGSGKSSLIQEIYKPVIERNGYLIQGKFDQYDNKKPCLALSRMLTDFTEQILTENQEQLLKWKKTILDAVGENGQILTDLAPAMEAIIGKQPRLVELDPESSQNRFLYILKQVVKVIASKEHPMVIFWDDMQWSDTTSLKLLESWLFETGTDYLFFIFSYRENEISVGHPFKVLIDSCVKFIPIQRIFLRPLSIESVKQMLSETLHRKKVNELAYVCHQKTGGNAFFLKQFLHFLFEKKLLYCDRKQNKWTWDISVIKEQIVSDNMVEMILKRLDTLSYETKNILSLGACVGNIFDLKTVANLSDQSELETAQQITAALQENYLIPLNENYKFATEIEDSDSIYQFSHDKIREAAHQLIDEDEQAKLHLKIGNLLKASCPKKNKLYKNIITIVEHLNKGSHLITQITDQYELAHLNLQAGLKAKSSQAYEQALYYLEKGLSLLSQGQWDAHYTLTLGLNTEAAGVSALLAEYDKMELYSTQVIKNAHDILDTIKVYRIKIAAYLSQGEEPKAIKTAMQILKRLKYRVPFKPNLLQMGAALIKARFSTRGFDVDKLHMLPQMQNERVKAIIQILSDITAPCFQGRPELALVLMCSSIHLTMRYGYTDFAPYSFVCYGAVLAGVFGDYDKAYKYGRFALNLINKLQLKFNSAKVNFIYYYLIHAVKEYYKTNLKILNEGYKLGLETGDYEYAIYCLSFENAANFFSGNQLKDAYDICLKELDYILPLKQKFKMTMYHKMHLQVMYNLIEQSEDGHHLYGPHFDEREEFHNFYKNNDLLGITMLYILKMMLAVLFGQFEEALQYSNRIQPHTRNLLCCFHYPIYLFYHLLTHIALYPKLSLWERMKFKYKIYKGMRQLKALAQSAPANYLHKYYLIKAEFLKTKGHFDLAIIYYQKAIETARNNEFVSDEALAKELLANFYLERGQKTVAKVYLLDAYNTYSSWGAHAKLRQLEKNYNWLTKFTIHSYVIGQLLSVIASERSFQAENLDYSSAMKATVAIANEIVLPKLITRLFEILIENMGAERCVLLKNVDNKLLIEGEYTAKNKLLNLMQYTPLDASNDLPLTVINYVHGTKESVVLDDASSDKKYMRDAYVMNGVPKSILCLPIIHQGSVTGILYLENNLLTGVFTSERLEFLKILSSQIAISIENAQLYQSFERFVPKRFLELLGKTDFSTIKLGDSIQKTLTVLFADIRNFTSLTEQKNVVSVFEILNNYLSYLEPVITKHNGFIDKFVGDAILALFPDKPENALDAAIEIQQNIALFNQQYNTSLSTGIGISTGLCLLGTVGSLNRTDVSVIGNPLNMTSRLESLNKIYATKILISNETKLNLNNAAKYSLRLIGNVELKGITSKNTVWEVLDAWPADIKEKKIATLSRYQSAIAAYQKEDFKTAYVLFLGCLKHYPDDGVILYYLNRCKEKMHITKSLLS